jgi:hypothetical protein
MANAPDFEPQFVVFSGSGEGKVVSRAADLFLLTDGTEVFATYSLDGGHTWFAIPNNVSVHAVNADGAVHFKWNFPQGVPVELMIAYVANE